MTLPRALVLLPLALFAGVPAAAQRGPITQYNARLSSQDHFSSDGVRLRTVAAIIRQDRANVYRFARPDREDEGDDFFDKAANRDALERMIAHSRISPVVSDAIINGEPLVHVDVYRGYVVIMLR